jgi:alpha-1,3-rhamnosyl/mannosyltransferase
VHDLSVLRHPEWHPTDRVQWYEREFSTSLTRSRHFITVSQFTRQEMMEVLHIPAECISVVSLAAREQFHPRPREEVQRWLAQRGWPNDYILYVGTIEPRKNLEGVLAAYSQLPVALRRRTSLLVVGPQGWGNERVRERVEHYGLRDAVRFLGYMEDAELSYLYCGARLLLWPSFYEGFGLPPLECMASGTPVVSSNCSSIPEVVGDAGILIDPRDTQKISEAIRSVLEDETFAQTLSDRGLARSKLFSWSRCATEHAALYRQYAVR